MKTSLFITLLLIANLFACKSTKPLQANQEIELRKNVESFIAGFNNREKESLIDFFHKDYQSLSPINQPKNLAVFIENTLSNLEKNNFEVAIKIKEIDAGAQIAYVSMDWQLKTKGVAKAIDPYANVQRVDIWKKDTSNKWCIFRTIIYNEKAF